RMVCCCFQDKGGIRDDLVTGVQTCALPILTRGPARCVEADAPRLAVRVDEAREEAGTVDADPASREIARDRGELALLTSTLLVAREAERRERADDDEANCNGPHRQRIGKDPAGIERHGVCGSEPLVHFGTESGHRRRSGRRNLVSWFRSRPGTTRRSSWRCVPSTTGQSRWLR